MVAELMSALGRNRAGETAGIWAACSAHPTVLEACLVEALANDAPMLIEATCNQVNQEGGYTGMTPADFRDAIVRLADAVGYPAERVVLGGDHLGPNPWRGMPAEPAMQRAAEMVAAYVEAGFAKIHLDASMACAGDPVPLPAELVAGRVAALCRAAESAAGTAARPVYVIGTEVPTPGGAQETLDHLEVTRIEDLDATIELHRRAFAAAGLEGAWERVIAVVVQPGVEFGHDRVVDFVPDDAAALTRAIERHERLVFEAHSTDYQTAEALRALVSGHFAILKVGPGLTYALREALFALEAIEAECLSTERRSGVRTALDGAMQRDPTHWRGYYHGSTAEQAFARAWSLSDRCRYYLGEPAVRAAIDRLVANLLAEPPPLPLVSQHLPVQYAALRAGRLANDPRALIQHKVREVARLYAWACGEADTLTV